MKAGQPERSGITGILLAAGASRRFGSDKLTRLLPENVPVAVQACRNLGSGTDRVLAVIRPGAENLKTLLEAEGAEVAVCPQADQGMGVSLAFGIQQTTGAPGWLVALADMPWIKPSTNRLVAAALSQGAAIAAPIWQGQRGHPVGFAANFRNELCALTGDTGAKALLAANLSHIVTLDCGDPGILWDIDRPEDLLQHLNHQRHES